MAGTLERVFFSLSDKVTDGVAAVVPLARSVVTQG